MAKLVAVIQKKKKTGAKFCVAEKPHLQNGSREKLNSKEHNQQNRFEGEFTKKFNQAATLCAINFFQRALTRNAKLNKTKEKLLKLYRIEIYIMLEKCIISLFNLILFLAAYREKKKEIFHFFFVAGFISV